MADERRGIFFGWLMTPMHALVFIAVLLLFHPVQVIAHLLGYAAHKRVVDLLNLMVLWSLKPLGTRIELVMTEPLPESRPFIVVSNHQSMYDIPMLAWMFRRHHPKFVAKKELGRWLPSVSFNLRHGGSALIDRANPRQALPALQRFGQRIGQRRHTACLFPEGTRARDGKLKGFNGAGLLVLLRAIPDALVVPVVIDGSWHLMRHGMRPIPFGVRVTCTALAPIDAVEVGKKNVVGIAEARIRERLPS